MSDSGGMTNKDARDTLCPIRPPIHDGRTSACLGRQCQLWTADPESGLGRCAYAFAALAMVQLPEAVGTSVYNAVVEAGAALRKG